MQVIAEVLNPATVERRGLLNLWCEFIVVLEVAFQDSEHIHGYTHIRVSANMKPNMLHVEYFLCHAPGRIAPKTDARFAELKINGKAAEVTSWHDGKKHYKGGKKACAVWLVRLIHENYAD